jgi:hypothetical protein
MAVRAREGPEKVENLRGAPFNRSAYTGILILLNPSKNQRTRNLRDKTRQEYTISLPSQLIPHVFGTGIVAGQA